MKQFDLQSHVDDVYSQFPAAEHRPVIGITGSGFDVNPKSLGYSTCTYVGINLEKGSMYKNVVEELQHIPEVVECHFTTGPYTMLVKLYARDNEQLMELLNGRLQGIHGVVATETLISLEQSIKRDIPVSFEEQ